MKDLAPTLSAGLEEGKRFALATVVRTAGSSPRGLGAAMAVREDGLIAGSVSGGCVEGAVVEAAMRALSSGKPEMLSFGSGSEAVLFEVGLSCGGQIDVWVEPLEVSDYWKGVVRKLQNGEAWLRVTKLSSERSKTCLYFGEEVRSNPFLEALTSPDAARTAGIVELGGSEYFVHLHRALDRLILVGAVHIAVPLVQFASALGFETIVIDPRAAFAKSERFPHPPASLIHAWPKEAFEEIGIDASSFVVTLSHDPKIDDPALQIALEKGAAYVGALGSKKTQAQKRDALKSAGLSEEQISRIHGPVGLEIGAQTPEEIALSILAEIVQTRRRDDG